MTVTVTPLNQTETGDFAAELSGIDLKKPIAGEDGEAVQGALWQYAVIVFHDQHLDDETQFTFSRIFGELEIAGIRPEMKRETDNPHFSDLSNIDGDGHILPADNEKMMFQRGNRLWHTDSSFKPIPAGPSILTGRTLPPVGGDTQFADMRAAFDALSDDDKALVAGRIGEHSLFHSRRRDGFDDFTDEERVTWKPVPQALVRTHPESGRKALFAGSHLGAIQGMDDQEAAPLIDRLNDHAAEDRFVHTHEWALGDVVVWDNRCVLHRGMPYDKAKYVRNMRRTTVAGLGLTVENGAAVDEYAAAHAAG